jgi:hypothetical protein
MGSFFLGQVSDAHSESISLESKSNAQKPLLNLKDNVSDNTNINLHENPE